MRLKIIWGVSFMYDRVENKKSGTFFQEYQKQNVMIQLQKTLEKIINQWLTTDDVKHTKLESLQQVEKMDVNSDEFPKNSLLPDFVIRLWQDPHQALNALDSEISKTEIKNLIKKTAKEAELVYTNQKGPKYS